MSKTIVLSVTRRVSPDGKHEYNLFSLVSRRFAFPHSRVHSITLVPFSKRQWGLRIEGLIYLGCPGVLESEGFQ
jgi:hypothetical protein